MEINQTAFFIYTFIRRERNSFSKKDQYSQEESILNLLDFIHFKTLKSGFIYFLLI